MSLNLKVFCYHKDEPEDPEIGDYPSHEMVLDSITDGEANFVCPECFNEVYVAFAEQSLEVTEEET